MTKYDSVGMTRWRDILLRLTGKRHRGKALNIIIWEIPCHVCWRSAVDNMKPLHARAPGFDFGPWNFIGRVVWIVFLYNFFFYLLAGFILLVLPHYSFASCCVKRIFIFAYNAFEWREYLGAGFYCSGNRSVVCMPNALAPNCLTHWMGLALKFKKNVRKNKVL